MQGKEAHHLGANRKGRSAAQAERGSVGKLLVRAGGLSLVYFALALQNRPRTCVTTPLRSKRPWIRSLMLLHLEICQQSRPWECGNPEGISKECGKGGKPASWLSMLSILCHFHGLLWKTHFTKSQSLRRPVLGTGTTCPRCRLSGGA